jgi:hypothetical protein
VHYLLQIADMAQQSFFHKLADRYASPCLLVLGQPPSGLRNTIEIDVNGKLESKDI